jgi:hypothetical protein
MAMRVEDALAALQEAAGIAAARGSLIFHLDLATELARIALTAQGIATDDLATMVDEQGYRVFAFAEMPMRRATAEVRFGQGGEAILLPAPPIVPPRALTIADARATIVGTGVGSGAAQAAIVIPSSDPRAPIEAYAIAVGESAETLLWAGHHALTLDPAGRHVTGRRAIELADPAASDMPAVQGALFSCPGPVPDEMHTYLALKHGAALRVETRGSGLCWRIDGERTEIETPLQTLLHGEQR